MNLKRKIFSRDNEFLFAALLVVIVALIVAGWRWSRLHNSKAVSTSSSDSVHVYLEDKTNLHELSNMLADSGVVYSREEVVWAGNLLGWRNFSPGHYLVDEPYSYEEFLSKLAKGIQDPVKITIPPGMSEEQIVDRISTNLKFDSLDFRKAIEDSTLYDKYDIERRDLIGRFLPDTYSVYWTSSPESILNRIFESFRSRAIEPYRDRIEEIDKSINEIVTLASIVVWEANLDDEKPMISGVYWNRLNSGMRLQADPTVNFAVKERRRITFDDYKLDHPYNTYRHAGLPPGPITNPDLNSIRAALYPEEHDYLYMVASPEGKHVFAETFEEHKENSAKWRKWLEEQYRIKREMEAEEAENQSD